MWQRILFLLCCWPAWALASITWVTDYEQARAQAVASERPLFVYFDARWCSWCHRYLDETLSEPQVSEYLQRHYIPVKVDWDARPDLVREYRANGLPFTVLLSPQGEIRNRFVGLVNVDDLLARLRYQGMGRDDLALRLAELPLLRPEGTDELAWERFHGEWLDYLERLWWPPGGGLLGLFDTGLSLKWPQPMSWIWLEENGLWQGRAALARDSDLARLWDRHDGGFFNYAEPRAQHLETSKLLAENAWLAAWYASAPEREGREAASAALTFMRGLRSEHGGLYQARQAAQDYYALPPGQRQTPPPVDDIVRADSNGSAIMALACAAQRGLPGAQVLAEEAMDGLWRNLWQDGRLHHARRGELLGGMVWPEDSLYLLAAAAALHSLNADSPWLERVEGLLTQIASWAEQARASGQVLHSDRAAILAWVAAHPHYREAFAAEVFAWAITHLELGPETLPDRLVPGLAAWQRSLGNGLAGSGCW